MIKTVNYVGTKRFTSYLPTKLSNAQSFVQNYFEGKTVLFERVSASGHKNDTMAYFCSVFLKNSSTGQKISKPIQFWLDESKEKEQIEQFLTSIPIGGVTYDEVTWNAFKLKSLI